MRIPVKPLLFTVLALAGTLATNPGYSQTPTGPDVAGFRPRVAIQDGYRALKAYNPKAQIKAQEVSIPEIGAKPLPQILQLAENGDASAEIIELLITLPPGAQTVYKVTRILNFEPGKEMTRANVMAALREKYGPEFSFGGNQIQFMWFFDERGQPANRQLFPQCGVSLGKFAPELNQVVGPYLRPTPLEPQCSSLFFVKAVITGNQGESGLITKLAVAATDVGLATRAEAATYSHILSVQGAQNKQVIDKAQQQGRPKL